MLAMPGSGYRIAPLMPKNLMPQYLKARPAASQVPAELMTR